MPKLILYSVCTLAVIILGLITVSHYRQFNKANERRTETLARAVAGGANTVETASMAVEVAQTKAIPTNTAAVKRNLPDDPAKVTRALSRSYTRMVKYGLALLLFFLVLASLIFHDVAHFIGSEARRVKKRVPTSRNELGTGDDVERRPAAGPEPTAPPDTAAPETGSLGHGPSHRPEAHDWRLTVFCTVFSLAMLFHFAKPSTGITSPASALLFGAAVLLLFRPSVGPLLLTCAAQLIDGYLRSPNQHASEYFTSIVCATILLAAGLTRQFSRHSRPAPDVFLAECCAVIRLELVLLMFAAVFHKLNVDFFNPSTTEATYVFGNLGISNVPLLAALSPYLTLITEGAICLGLCLRRTSHWAIFLLLGMWLVIGFARIFQFSSILYLAAFACMSAKPAAGSGVAWNFIRRVRAAHLGWAGQTMRLLLVVYFLAAALFPTTLVLTCRLVWLLYGVIFIALTMMWSRTTGSLVDQGPLLPARWQYRLLVVVFCVLEAGTYAGYRAWPSFRMYSNLRVECASNHFLIPQAILRPPRRHDLVWLSADTLAKLSPYGRGRWFVVNGRNELPGAFIRYADLMATIAADAPGGDFRPWMPWASREFPGSIDSRHLILDYTTASGEKRREDAQSAVTRWSRERRLEAVFLSRFFWQGFLSKESEPCLRR